MSMNPSLDDRAYAQRTGPAATGTGDPLPSEGAFARPSTEPRVVFGDGGAGMARAIYLAFIGGFFVPLITLIAVIVAYVHRDPGLRYSPHFTFQIRTFWWGVVMQLTALVLYLALVAQAAMGGSFVALLLPIGLALWWALFTIMRISRGLRALNRSLATVA